MNDIGGRSRRPYLPAQPSDSRISRCAAIAPFQIPDADALLEIKCPYGKGQPYSVQPWDRAPWYYMAQVQTVMEIFDMAHCHLYCWTIRSGSRTYIIERDREYFKFVLRVCEEFWSRNLVPARTLLLESDGDPTGVESFRPRATSALTEYTKVLSQRMASKAECITYGSKTAS